MNIIKKFFPAITTLLIIPLIASCSNNNGVDVALSDINYVLDFDNEQLLSELNTKPLGDAGEWCIETIGKDTADSNGNTVDKNEKVIVAHRYGAAIPDGAYNLFIGEKDWANYSVSFDFYMGEGTWLNLGIYDQTLKIDTKMGECRIGFSLNNEGRLHFETIPFYQYGYDISVEESNEPFIKGFDPNVWNHIELIPKDGSLILNFNGKEAGAICSLKDKEYGRFSIDGGEGCMFRNISAKGKKLIEQ